MFLDVAKIECKAGDGGDGAIAWRREKFEPSGGPYGGDGGHGGSILLEADENVQTLMDYKYQRHYKAQRGENGKTKRQFGKRGEDLILKVPVGTIVREFHSKKVVADLKENGQRFTVAKGGRGGRGNAKFANSIRQAPRFAEPGQKGQEITILLEVKLIADVGLVGLPNVGKSSILSILTEAKPKIANYHFTTLEPNLGVVKIDRDSSYVIADIPGLIEGASEGLGLGHDFLRHVERTRVLVHVLDMAGSEGRDPMEDFRLIQSELEQYNVKLEEKVKIIVANKMDIPGADVYLEFFREEFPDYRIIETSAATTQGMEELKYAIWEELQKTEANYDSLEDEMMDIDQFFRRDETIHVEREGDTIYVTGEPVEELGRRLILTDGDSIRFFESQLEEMGVMDRIRELHPTSDDTIDVVGFQFDYWGE